MKKIKFGPTIALLVPGFAFAHHSQAPYDMASEVIIDGTVVELEWRNPHIAMMLEVIGEDGEPFLQEVELASVSEVRALGIDEAAIPLGARVAVRAHPGRRGPGSRVFGVALTRSDGTRVPLHPFAGFANITDTGAEASGLAGRWAPGAAGLTDVFGVMLNWPYTDAAGAALQDTLGREGSSLGVCEDFPPPLVSIFPDLREIAVICTTKSRWKIRRVSPAQPLSRCCGTIVPTSRLPDWPVTRRLPNDS